MRSGRAGLVEVGGAGNVTVYEVPDARQLLTGPGEAHITSMEHDRVEGEVSAPGTYRLAVRWTPTWRVESGDVCVEEGPDAMTQIVASAPGPFTLGIGWRPKSPGCPGAGR